MQLPWWRRLPTRMVEEDAALHALREDELRILLSHRWTLVENDELRLLAQIRAGARTVDLEVRFPAHYPEGCPSVRPVPYDTRISGHQFLRSGILCLELGPDNWHPTYTAADMIRSAWRLVLYEKINDFEPLEIPSRHVPTLGERVARAKQVFLRSSEFDARVRDAAGQTDFEVLWRDRYLAQFVPVDFPKGSPLSGPKAMLEGGTRVPARLVPLATEAPTPIEVPEEPTAFDEFVKKHGDVDLDAAPSMILLRWADGETQGYLRTQTVLLRLENIPLEIADSSRTPDRLHAKLSSLKIGIVGLGSLGSKVAVSLARSGVRRFVLVDGDVMTGENVCRHQGSFQDVGVMKVAVAKQLIQEVSAAEPKVGTYTTRLGAATNPELHAEILEKLASCDVLVDATANPDAFGLMAGLASDHQRAMVWAEVFGGGLGGMIGSAHPLDGPCPRCVRAGFLAVSSAWPPAPYIRSGTAYSAEEDPTLVASDADVSLVAAALTSRINDLALRDELSMPSVLLLGLRRGWIFETPMQTIPVHVRSDDVSCARCWRAATEPDPDAAALVEGLLAHHDHAHDPSHA